MKVSIFLVMSNYSFPLFKILDPFYLTQTKTVCVFTVIHLKSSIAISSVFFFLFINVSFLQEKRTEEMGNGKENGKKYLNKCSTFI